MPFELFVALRFLREGRAQTALILAGATVGVAVIVFLSALISGLQATLVEQTLSSQPHVTLRRPEPAPRVLPAPPGTALAALVEKTAERERSVDGWQQVLEAVRAAPGVVAATPVAGGSGFARRAGLSRPIVLRGIEPASFDAVLRLERKLSAGRLRVEGGEAVLGARLARDLGVGVGDKVRLSTPEGGDDLFTVSGLFDAGNEDVNARWVLVSLRAGQSLLDLPGGVTAVEAKVADVFEAEAVARALAGRTGLLAESWMERNAQLLTALRSQSASSAMIQVFVVLAVALGIASVLGVSVVQKAREIGILRATGTSTGTVLRVFLIQGGIVGVVGSLAGGLLGAGIGLLFASLVKNPYGEALFPLDLRPSLFLLASAVATLTGLAAAAFPARHAARLDPAVVIRHG